jgi:hypothetical protein
MNGDFCYRLSSLPALGDLGAAPPVRPRELLDLSESSPPARPIVEALLLHEDLRLREGLAARELRGASSVVLTAAQVSGESPLPPYLRSESGRPIDADATWEAYFRFVASVARTCGCEFLARWVGFEVALRNALAVARASRLRLDAEGYLVATELGEPSERVAAIVGERNAARTPLAEFETLIKARWMWVADHEAWFSFSVDEFAAYAAKLILLIQYRRLVGADDARGSKRGEGRAVA